MKRKKVFVLVAILALGPFFSGRASAQIPIVNLVTSVIKKVIVAMDLQVQRLQNKTIALQNAAQQVQNTLHLNSLNNISGWLNKEKDLYAGYYQELNKVRRLIADYSAIKKIIEQQASIVSEYRKASARTSADPHFSPTEINYMANIYSGILQESLRNLDALTTTISDAALQLDDAERLTRIGEASRAIQTNLDHLRQFNRQNAAVSLARSRDAREAQSVKQIYGIN